MTTESRGRRGRPARSEVYRRLDEAFEQLRTRMGGLPGPVEAEDIWKAIWFEEAHHSTALEGNTLVLKQVEQLLAEGRAVGRAALPSRPERERRRQDGPPTRLPSYSSGEAHLPLMIAGDDSRLRKAVVRGRRRAPAHPLC
jgi:hypothetical protein